MTYENPPRYRDVDSIGKAGYMLAAVGALLVVVALIVWPGPTDQQTASNPAPQTGGIGAQDSFPPPIRKR